MSVPPGGNVLVQARTLRRSRLKGRCRKAAPLSIPRPHRRNCVKAFRVAIGDFIERYRMEYSVNRALPKSAVPCFTQILIILPDLRGFASGSSAA